MKNIKNKDISISDLANEFHVSKAAIELYGVNKLLLPIPDKKNKPAYRPLDKARLKIIIRAKNADYTIGNIKNLIGVLDLGKNEVDQIEESLVYSKKISAELKDSLEELDALEQINVTCDLELLEGYITDLNNLKYGLDITPIKKLPPEPDTETPHSKPSTLVYSHVDDQINAAAAPAIAQKKSRTPLFVVAGIFLVAISGYLYLGGDFFPDISNNPSVTSQVEPAEIIDAAVSPNKTEEIYLSETETASDEPDEIYLSETDLNPDERGDPLADEVDLTEDSFSPLEFPALKNELPPSAHLVEGSLEADQDEQPQEAKTTQALLEAINNSRETEPKTDTLEKEKMEDVFFKQLIADLTKKYDEKKQTQRSDTNDTTKINAAPEKMSEEKETQNLVAVVVPRDAPQKSQPKTTASPKKVAPVTITQAPTSSNTRTPSTNMDVPLQPEPSPKPVSSAVKTNPSTIKATTSTKKTETSTIAKRNKSASKAITPPNPKIKSEPELKPVPKPKSDPKPKTVPQKPADPEALKWTQKSYESVMSGDAGEAIIAASVAITLDPNLVNAYINRSWAYSKKGLYDRAIQDCDKALDLDKDNALAYNNRGLAFQGKGDMVKAKADYDRACKLGFDIGCKNYQEVVESLADNS